MKTSTAIITIPFVLMPIGVFGFLLYYYWQVFLIIGFLLGSIIFRIHFEIRKEKAETLKKNAEILKAQQIEQQEKIEAFYQILIKP
jgi:uncharacterized membrane-anchored protein YhcB (DUF1043 family)